MKKVTIIVEIYMTIIVKSIISKKNYRLTIKVDLLKSEWKITEHNCRL